MPKFAVIHHAPGVTPEQFQENVPDILANRHATFLHCYANMATGLIVNLYDASRQRRGRAGDGGDRVPLRRDRRGSVRCLGGRPPGDAVGRVMTATTTSTAAKSLDWFGAGGPSKVPLKANVFATMMNHQGMQQQKELFPYFENGDLVPAAAFSYSLPDMPRFHFFHYNDQQEIVLCLAAEGGSLNTGQLYVQNTTHGVTTFLKNPNAPEMEAYQVCIIVIRMKDEGPQNEAKMFRCSSCNEVVFRFDRDVLNCPPHKYYQELPNVRLYADAVDAFNASDRTCPKCGLVQDEFPQDIAGWRRYAQYADLANRAREQIDVAAQALVAPRHEAAGSVMS